MAEGSDSVRFIYVGGPFGSGTTATAGALASAGVDSMPPHHRIKDRRTPNTYESIAFRKIIFRYVNERRFLYDARREAELVEELSDLKEQIVSAHAKRVQEGGDGLRASVLFKMPTSALCVVPIIEVFNPCFVLVTRSFREIEATRIRRGWPPVYGVLGARKIYSTLLQTLLMRSRSFIAVGYHQLCANPADELIRVLDYAGLEKEHYDIDAGIKFVRLSPQSGISPPHPVAGMPVTDPPQCK